MTLKEVTELLGCKIRFSIPAVVYPWKNKKIIYLANFEKTVEVMDGAFGISICGQGKTIHLALKDLCRQISGQVIKVSVNGKEEALIEPPPP
jgi:hypothetical protein